MKPYFLIPLFFQKLVWVPVRLTFYLFIRMKVEGLENLHGLDRRVIFAANHPCELDPAFIPAAIPFWSRFSPIFGASREKSYYAKLGWRRHFYGRWFFVMWGGSPVYAGLHNYEQSVRNHIRLIQDRATLVIFPEGGISRDGLIHPAKGGIAFLAERVNCPIIPIGISGAVGLNFKDFFLRRRKVVVRFGSVITQQEIKDNVPRPANFSPSIYRVEADYVMRKVGELIGG
ncbi:MAG: lysophospholipid acyltransferase family protein [Patescibacteria group bacterium]